MAEVTKMDVKEGSVGLRLCYPYEAYYSSFKDVSSFLYIYNEL